jgi:hypothetical protein
MALTLGIHQCTQFGSDSENLLRFTEYHHQSVFTHQFSLTGLDWRLHGLNWARLLGIVLCHPVSEETTRLILNEVGSWSCARGSRATSASSLMIRTSNDIWQQLWEHL